MLNFLKLAAISFALAHLTRSCGNGCLKCTTPEVCDLCDTTNAFLLDNGKCVQKTLENCTTYNLEGKCLACGEGLYLNKETQKCVTIEKFKEVENCSLYST